MQTMETCKVQSSKKVVEIHFTLTAAITFSETTTLQVGRFVALGALLLATPDWKTVFHCNVV